MIKRLRRAFGQKTEPLALPPEDRPAYADRPRPVDISDADFARVVLDSDRPVVVDFWADWCEPCQTMSTYVEFLAADYGERLLVTAMDVEENPETPAGYDILGLPTLLFLRNGVEVERQVGLLGYPQLRQKVEQLLEPPHA